MDWFDVVAAHHRHPGLTWFHYALFAFFALGVVADRIKAVMEWRRDREWRKKRGLSPSEVREVQQDMWAREAEKQRRLRPPDFLR